MKILVLGTLLLVACTKAPEPVPTPDPRIELEKMGAVAMKPAPAPQTSAVAAPQLTPAVTTIQVVKKVHHPKPGLSKAEMAAYKKAYHNAALANQFLGEQRFRTKFHSDAKGRV